MTILNAEQAASLLEVTRQTLMEKARSGEIPAAKFGDHWFFPMELLTEWMIEQARQQTKQRRAPETLAVPVKATGKRGAKRRDYSEILSTTAHLPTGSKGV